MAVEHPASPFSSMDTVFWQPFTYVLPAGAFVTLTANQAVDMWAIGIVPGDGIIVNCYPGSAVGGIATPLGGGGSAKLPAQLNTFTFENIGTQPARISAIATRNMPWISVSPGSLE